MEIEAVSLTLEPLFFIQEWIIRLAHKLDQLIYWNYLTQMKDLFTGRGKVRILSE